MGNEQQVFGKDATPQHCAFVMTKHNFQAPALQLPGFKKPVVAIRCCPILFERMEGESLFDLPYRIVYAVASQDAVCFFDTQHTYPLATVTGLHYHHITDIAWTNPSAVDDTQGLALAVSSADGYCSFINFPRGELGDILAPHLVPALMRQHATAPQAAPSDAKGVAQPMVKRKIDQVTPLVSGGAPQQTPDATAKPSHLDVSLEKKEKKRRIVPDLVEGESGNLASPVAMAEAQDPAFAVYKAEVRAFPDASSARMSDEELLEEWETMGDEEKALYEQKVADSTKTTVPKVDERRRITPQVETEDAASGKKRIAPALVSTV